MSVLDVSDLRVLLPTADGLQPAVDGVGFTVGEREIVGVAGESGSGKTISMLALLGLTPPGARVTGTAEFGGQDLLALKGRALRDVRGRSIAVVFQDPMTSLHPMLTIGRQLTEHVRHHLGLSKKAARDRAAELLEQVRIPDPRGALDRYPHQFSGGMRQRIAIAMALGCSPDVLIADEPTTALDVTVQAGILRLLDRLRTENGLSIILITHDLGVLSSVADRLYVYYAGRIVETGPTPSIIQQPRHPYTRGLLHALPREETGLTPIGGTPPSLGAIPAGCAFHPRCAFAEASCAVDRPELVDGLACPINPLVSS